MIQEKLQALFSRARDMGQESAVSDVADMVGAIQDAYVSNAELLEHQAPYAVFEALVGCLADRVVTGKDADERLLTALERLDASSPVVAPLIDRLRSERLSWLDSQLASHPLDADARRARARLRLAVHDPQGALDDLLTLGETADPRDLSLRVSANLALCRFTEALDAMNRRLEVEPADSAVRLARARLYFDRHYPDLARADVDILARSEDARMLAFCARFFLQQRDPEMVVRLANHFSPGTEARELSLLLARALLMLGQYEEAAEIAATVLPDATPAGSTSPDEAHAQAALQVKAIALHRMGKPAEAARVWLHAFGLFGVSYETLRGYVAATDELLNEEIRSLDRQHLGRLASADVGEPDAKMLASYAQALARRSDPRAELLRSSQVAASDARTVDGADACANAASLWVESNMTMELRRGLPWSVQIRGLQSTPFIERLPWTFTVQCLEFSDSRREVRRAVKHLFRVDLPSLRSLIVSAELFSYECVDYLVAAPFYPRLRELELRGCDLDAPAVELVVRHLPKHIETLRIFGARTRPPLGLKRRLGRLFQTCRTLDALATLELVDCDLGVEEVRRILNCSMPSLTTLNLSANDLSGMDAAEFVASPLIDQLRDLAIGYSGIEKAVLPLLLEQPEKLRLRQLSVAGNWQPSEIQALRRAGSPIEQIIDFGASPESAEDDWLAC